MWQYEGVILRYVSRMPLCWKLLFNRPDTPFMDVVLKENDRFVETFYCRSLVQHLRNP
jgi:hypothetical protein